ncbi:MAG: hypothetical protein H0X62_11505 [Bacteroidetes bacterium]|nr:hypothetical protein [Bacteroidota bacterium]
MRNFIQKNLLTFIGIPVGAIAGYAYWHYVGCLSGNCSITSVWYNSAGYGAIMGGLLFSMFKKEEAKKEENR